MRLASQAPRALLRKASVMLLDQRAMCLTLMTVHNEIRALLKVDLTRWKTEGKQKTGVLCALFKHLSVFFLRDGGMNFKRFPCLNN